MDSQKDPIRSSLSRGEISTIREICSIAAAQAASALSNLMNVGVVMSVPDLHVLPIKDVPGIFGEMDASTVGVIIPFHGDVQGNILFLFPDEGAGELTRALFPDGGGESRDLVDSALMEIGNILSGVFLTLLSRISGRIILNLPPILARDMAGALLDTTLAEAGAASDRIMVLSSSLKDGSGNRLANVVIIPDSMGMDLFLEAGDRMMELQGSPQGKAE